MKKLFTLIATVGLFLACSGGGNSPIDVVKAANDALQAKDYATAATYIHVEDEADREKLPQFIEMMYGLAEQMNPEGIVVSTANYTEEATDNPDEVIVHFEATTVGGEVNKEKVTCIRTADGTWLTTLD